VGVIRISAPTPSAGYFCGDIQILATLISAFVIPGFSPIADEPNGGQLLTGTFAGTARPGFIYLPPAFDSSRRYPVVYLLHGLPGSPSEYIDSLQLGQFADSEITSGAMRPFIAIVPAAGTTPHYGGEWAGPWETALIKEIVPWVDAQLPTVAGTAGRILAGLSAGGFGAVNIAVRHPGVFGAVESWSGYFQPLHDAPFVQADHATLAANDPTLLVRTEAPILRADRVRFFVSTGPYHSHLISPGSTPGFAQELRGLRLPVTYRSYPSLQGEWSKQFDEGLIWALAP